MGTYGLLSIVSGMAVSLELAESSFRMVRRQGDIIKDGKLISEHEESTTTNHLTANFNNGNFEFITQSTDSVGDPVDSHVLDAPKTECPGGTDSSGSASWTCSGTVVLVPSDNTQYGGLASPHGGVHLALKPGATLTQKVANHKTTHVYQLTFDAASMPKAKKADGTCSIGCADNECCDIDYPEVRISHPETCGKCGKVEVHLTGASKVDGDLLAVDEGANGEDYTENLISSWVNQDFVYKPTAAGEVTIKLKNASPHTILIDDLELTPCDTAGDCSFGATR